MLDYLTGWRRRAWRWFLVLWMAYGALVIGGAFLLAVLAVAHWFGA